MNHISRVLVAIDFSTPARNAFDHALALSRHHDAELIAVQAVPNHHTFRRDARARVALHAKLRQQAQQANVDLSVRVQSGNPAEIVLLHARSLRPDLIVMGTHQRRGLERFRVGSVAERVAAKSTMPVLLVPRHARATASPPFGHVVVAVDFSAGSTAVIERALSLAKAPTDRITLIHVVPAAASGVPLHLYGYGLELQQAPSFADVRRRLKRVLPAHARSRPGIDVQVLVGDPATEISHAAESIGADLLVVGGTTRGIASRALFGTTTARLLRMTPIPMLAVPDVPSASGDQADAVQRLAA